MVGQFQGEKGRLLVDEAEEDFVTFPHCKFQKTLFFNPFEVTFITLNLFAGPVGADKEMHVFALPDIGDEGNDAAVAPLGDGEASLFPHFAEHTFLGAFALLEFSSHAEPFVVVEVVFFFGAMEHEVLVTSFQIAEGGLFHSLDSQIPKNLSYTS